MIIKFKRDVLAPKNMTKFSNKNDKVYKSGTILKNVHIDYLEKLQNKPDFFEIIENGEDAPAPKEIKVEPEIVCGVENVEVAYDEKAHTIFITEKIEAAPEEK